VAQSAAYPIITLFAFQQTRRKYGFIYKNILVFSKTHSSHTEVLPVSYFSDKGREAVARAIDQSSSLFTQTTEDDPDFEVKSFTVKVPRFQLDLIDGVAAHLELPRSELVRVLVHTGLATAFIDYVTGYYDELSGVDEQVILDSLSAFLKNSELSPRSQKVFQGEVLKQLGFEND
jgi:hypothetical protein